MTARTQDPHRAVAELAHGAVVLMRTDTLPGLHARADHTVAVARIGDIKARTGHKPLLLLCTSIEAALALAAAPAAAVRRYVGRCWPGPVTLILPAGPAAPPAATRGYATVALRVPAPIALRALIAEAGGALVSTSVNRAGEPPAVDLDAAADLCGGDVDLIVDLDWGDPADAPAGPSTLLDLTTWPPVVVRPGAVAPPDWQEFGVSP